MPTSPKSAGHPPKIRLRIYANQATFHRSTFPMIALRL
jgi:hypothetical protein